MSRSDAETICMSSRAMNIPTHIVANAKTLVDIGNSLGNTRADGGAPVAVEAGTVAAAALMISPVQPHAYRFQLLRTGRGEERRAWRLPHRGRCGLARAEQSW